MMAETQQPLYKGSCHCGFTRYTCRINLNDPKSRTGEAIPIATRCNCSICVKGGALLATPVDNTFTLLSPPNISELSNYTFATHFCQHRFCPMCGIRCFLDGEVKLPDGGVYKFLRVNLQTIDGRVKDGEDGTSDGELEPMMELKDEKFGYWNLKYEDLMTPGLKAGSEPAKGGFW